MPSNLYIRIGIICITIITMCCSCSCAPEIAANLEERLTLDLGGGVTLDLVLIMPGTFIMGSTHGDDIEAPVHKVNITKGYYIAAHETTQEQWQAVVGSNPSHFKGPRNPVEGVNWEDCQRFIRMLENRVGKGYKFALPSEAQWEYACRAGSTGEYGYEGNAGDLGGYAWFKENAGGVSHPVGQKKPNGWGLYDMHGNVWEWCDESMPGRYSINEVTDPSSDGSLRGLRGGSWNDDAYYCRAAYRLATVASYVKSYYGFRIVMKLD